MPGRRSRLIAACLLAKAQMAEAQLLTSYFPEGVPGYGTEAGVTVRSRARPAYDPLGIRLGTVMLRPMLNEAFGYDDNVFTGPARRRAWEVVSTPSLLAGTAGSYGSTGLYLSANDVHYLGQSAQDRTDSAAFFGGTFNMGRDRLTLGAGWLAQHEDRTALDALPSDRPVAFTVANMRASYETTFGRVTATPSIDLNRWRFASTTILGVPVSQDTRDRSTGQLGLTLRYNWMSGRDLSSSHFDLISQRSG
jgi:hypothetical protein